MSNPPKKKGSLGERQVCDYLCRETGLDVRRLALSGTNDKGDLWGVTSGGLPVVVEVKKCKRQEVLKWWRETLREMKSAETELGALVSVEPGIGPSSMDRAKVWMDLKRLRLLAKGRDARARAGDSELVYLSLAAFALFVDHR